jgi:hypothetical protein
LTRFHDEKIRAGTLLFLLLLFFMATRPAAAAFRDHFAEPGDIGEAKIPRFGKSRIPIVIVSADAETLRKSADRALFENELRPGTFRKYWNDNSASAYDPQAIVFELARGVLSAPASAPDEKNPQSATQWLGFARDALAKLAESGAFQPAAYDINGSAGMPDGFFDGIIVLVDGLEGAYALPGDEGGVIKVNGIQLGPVLVAGTGASDYEILRGFAGLLGFADLCASAGPRGCLCLSLIGAPDGTVQPIDGYSRMRADWATKTRISGQPREIFILPSATSGQVYVIGGETEFFVLENRSSGVTPDGKPGIAIFHVDESMLPEKSKGGDAKPDVWRQPVMNEWPDGSFPIQTGGIYSPEEALFGAGGALLPDYTFQNPISEKAHPLNSNWNSGEPSDIVVKDIDTTTHYPIVSATVGVE